MTDDVGLLLNVTSRLVWRTVPGAPPSDDGWRRFHAPHHRHARPARVDGQRWHATPTLPQPLRHGAKRRYRSPFRGAEGWEEVCGVCASVYHDADTVVFLPPVRGGVLDAPRLSDCRAALDAAVRRGRLQSRFPRCARLASAAQRMQSRGRSPRTFGTGAPTSSVIPRRAGVEARPYGGMGLTGNVISPHPRCTNPSVTAQGAATAPLSGEPRGGRRFAALTHPFTTMLIH